MNKKKIYFLSSNAEKIREVKEILSSDIINVESVNKKIKEIQSDDMWEIAKDKVIKAYNEIHRPIIVEQTGLLISGFGDLPGGLTQVFWDALQAEKFSRFFNNNKTIHAEARTVVAYCNGKKIKKFVGTIKGNIVFPPRGDRTFQWDCVFEPEGYKQTFAEMGPTKNIISMRKIALEKLRKYLEKYNDTF